MNPTINLYHGDCMEAMKGMKDKQYDLAIVDPPYGVGDFGQPQSKQKPHNRDWKIEWNDEIPTQEYFEQVYRVSKNWIIWGANYYKSFVSDPGTIFWDKGNASDVGSQGELAATNLFQRVVMYKEQWAGFINSENATGPQKIHPCQKPIKLYRWLLKKFARPGWKILDTHGGSMSIAIACYDMGFDLDLWEIDKDYYEAGLRRFNDHKKQLKLFRA